MQHTHPQHLDLLAIVEAFIASSGMSKSSFGMAAMGDPCFVDQLRDGREPRRRTIKRVMEFIATGERYDASKHSLRNKDKREVAA
ncbi:hypothetical protein G5V65_11275 [Rhodobacter sp. HX-7-19]|uniref:XRE family transcriptional regulator n=1 Tax=Paragemmobacter kunshanensis TaxID=2583234 RepID=A0A6M1TT90_9RHOB|nr:hypothetical protein [Rhodobacter kunshanensis]NGQ91478.1 hypothetical protein [Rhodobacter kunshanensis]